MGKFLPLSASIVVAQLFAGAAFAETPAAAPRATIGGETDIVVTARRVEERLQDVPISITALGASELKQQVVREIKDVAFKAPNVQMRHDTFDTTGIQIGIRGQQQAETSLAIDGTVGVYVDGVNVPRVNGLRGALVDLDRVEILRGPQGTLYGRNTTGGAVSFITADPKNELGGTVRATVGRFNQMEILGILNVPIAEGVAVRLVAQHSENDGFAKDGGGGRLGDSRGTYLRGKAKVESGGFTATLTGEWQKYFTHGPSIRLLGLNPATSTMPEGGLTTIEIAREASVSLANALTLLRGYVGGSFYRSHGNVRPTVATFEGERIALNMEQELSDALSVRSISGYQHFDRYQSVDSDGTPFPILSGQPDTHDRFYSQELQLLGNMGPVSWVLGGYISHEKGIDFSPSQSLPALTGGIVQFQDGTLTSNSKAIFGQANWKVTDALTLTGGLRFTKETKKLVTRNRSAVACNVPVILRDNPAICSGTITNKFSEPSWLISADYKVTSDILVYGKVSRGFRAGGQNLRGATVTTFSTYDPEFATEYEVGFKADLFDRRVRLNSAVFYDDYSDIQRSIVIIDTTTLTTGTLVTNAAKARLQGFESELLVRPTDALTLSGTVGYLDGKYKRFVDLTGDRSRERFAFPDWSYTLGGRYVVPVAFGEVSLQADYRWQSSQNLAPAAKNASQVTQPSFGLLNARIALDVPSQQMTLAAFGKNILGKKYLVNVLSLEAIGYNRGNTGEPFTFGVEFTKNF